MPPQKRFQFAVESAGDLDIERNRALRRGLGFLAARIVISARSSRAWMMRPAFSLLRAPEFRFNWLANSWRMSSETDW
jgi:hypothetical protein